MSGSIDQVTTPDCLSASAEEFDPVREIKLLRRELARRLKSLRERDGSSDGSEVDPYGWQDLPQLEAKTPSHEKESYLDATALGPTKDRTAELFSRNLDQTTHFVSVLRQSDAPSSESVNKSTTETVPYLPTAGDETIIATELSISAEMSAVGGIDSGRPEIPEAENKKLCNKGGLHPGMMEKVKPGGISDCSEGRAGICPLTTNDVGKSLVQSIPAVKNRGDTVIEQVTIGMEQPLSLSFWLDTLNSWLVLFGFLGFLLGGLYLLGDHPRHPEPANVCIVTGLAMLVIGLLGRYLHLNCNQTREGGN